jgi:hypothetical protein
LWNSRAPQPPQKKHQITRSLATTRRHFAGVPLTTASASRATASDSANALPDWRWHSVQWQT